MADFAENGVVLKGPLVRSATLRSLARSLRYAPLCFAPLRFASLRSPPLTRSLASEVKKTTSALWYQTFPRVSERVSGAARSERASERSGAEQSGA